MENFDALRRRAPLVVEEAPSLYVYRLQMGNHVQTGIAAAFSIDEYDRDVIKKHERTRPDKEDDRTRHMLELRAQTGPVFLTYRASREVDAVGRRGRRRRRRCSISRRPTACSTRSGGSTAADVPDLVAAFDAIPALYIADGHHRAASAARARQQLAARRAPGDWTRVLAVAFPDNQMQVLPYNRVVKDLGGVHAADSAGASCANSSP